MTKMTIYEMLLEKHFHPQLIIPQLAEELGLEKAIIIQQLHYWLQKCGKMIDGNAWVYNTYNDWHKQFSYWSISKIQRFFSSLEKQGIILSKKLNACKSDHTKWYSINYSKLVEILSDCLPEKNFSIEQFELSSCQSDIINNRLTDNNHHNTNFLFKFKSNFNEIKKSNKPDKKSDRDNYFEKGSLRSIKHTTPLQNHMLERLDKKSIIVEKELVEEEKDICNRMIEVWNKIFLNEKDKAIMSNSRGYKLISLWEGIVGKDMSRWEELCIKVNSSKFLMGEKKAGFKAYFDWVICELTVRKILAGEYGVGDRVPDIDKEREKEREKEIRKFREENELKAEERRKEEIIEIKVQKLANELRSKALTELEHSWGRVEEERARKEFEEYMLSDRQEYKAIDVFKEEFRKQGWEMAFAEYVYTQFKLHHYIQKSEEDFLNVATRNIKATYNHTENLSI